MNLNLVVMAAGMGSRYGGLKQVEQIGEQGETLLEYSLYDAIQAGFNRVVFVIRPDMEDMFLQGVFSRVKEHIDACYVFQELNTSIPEEFNVPNSRQKPWGTAHAVLSAQSQIDGPFAVINADDFYGRDAFKLLTNFLKEDSPHNALVGYQLKNTLSSHGTVSRGICTTDKKGYLGSVEEYTRIARDAAGNLTNWDTQGNSIPLTGNETTSLNLWGFRQSFIHFLQSGFSSFLQNNINDPKAEWYLPAEVDRGIKEDSFKVEILPTDEEWFGVTYKEDLAEVVRSIYKKIQANNYPRKLWKAPQTT